MTYPIQSIIDRHTKLLEILNVPRVSIDAIYAPLQAQLTAASPVININTVGVH